MGWDIGLGEWVGAPIVTSEFVTRPGKKKKAGTKGTHTFSMVVFLSKRLISQWRVKRKDYLFFEPPAFFLLLHPNVSFPTSHVVFPTLSFFLNRSFFFNLGDFSNLTEWETEASFSSFVIFPKPKTPKT